MFERIYDGPRALARHQKTPFAKEREEYLNHLAQENRRPQTIEAFAGKLVAIANRIDISAGNSIDLEQIELAAADWAAGRRRFKRPSGRDRSRKRFIAVAKDWLRFLGRLQRPEDPIKVFADRLSYFASFLDNERGLSPITIRTWSGCIRRFLMWYRSQNCEFSEVGIEDIEKYFKLKGERWSRATAASTVGALRAFFRYAARREWLSAAIAESILGPRIFQHEALPKAPSWNTVQRLIDNAHTDRPVDIRDRAILLLFAVYGFRSGEVACLQLSDLDWESETITLVRSKPRKRQQYPLVQEVGEAILRYLQEVRPRGPRQELFLTMRPPFRPMTGAGLWDMTQARFARLGITGMPRGPHLLRHACASHLLEEGFSLKEIGDHLGHRNPQSTRIYAMVDLRGLREVARFELGGVL